jgi:hypothetical protein
VQAFIHQLREPRYCPPNQVNLVGFDFQLLGVSMSVSEISSPNSYGNVIKRIGYFSATAVLLLSALMLSSGLDLSPGFF